MGLATGLAVAGALGAGFLLGRKKKGKEMFGVPPAPAPTAKAEKMTRRSAAAEVQATKPVDLVKAASENQAAAQQVAMRTRRRAAAGSAGKVSTGAISAAQSGVRATGSAASLLGY